MTTKHSRLAFALIALGFFLRLAYVQFIHPIGFSIYSDMSNYLSIADMILKNNWQVTHFFQPIGYPYLLMILQKLSPSWMTLLEWLQISTSSLSLYVIWKMTKESFGEDLGLWALGISTIHFPWIFFTGIALAENLFIFFLSLLAFAALKLVHSNKSRFAVLWSLFFFLAFLTKGTHVFLAPLFVVGLLHYKKKLAIKNVIIIISIVSSGLIAHGFFTESKIGKFQMSASAGGLNFVEGKCPIKHNADSAGYTWLSPLYYQMGLHQKKVWDHPFTDSAYFMKEGFHCIKKYPLTLIQSFEGIPFLFMGNTLWPANQLKHASFIRLYEMIFVLFCIVGLTSYFRFLNSSTNRAEEILIWVLPIVSLFLCVYIFKSEIRFRIPFDIWIIPIGVKGWSQLIKAKIP